MKRILLHLLAFFLLIISYDVSASEHVEGTDAGWKAGVASVIITPTESMWMAGYAGRNHPSEGKLCDLWAKALALEDAKGKRSILVTMDLSGIPKSVSDRIRDRLKLKFELDRDQIILNTSHNHSGPVLKDALLHIYPLDSTQKQKIDQYTMKFEDQIIILVGKALHSMNPVGVYSGNGITRFQVNRRNNNEATLSPQTELKGPNDYAVPVMKVIDKSGGIVAIVFGYACHNTVLSGYQWSGDYAGYAQSELEREYPGTTALFFQGCGGNQNPLPRRTVALAKQYGKELAAAVEEVLNGDMAKLSPHLKTTYSEIDLALNKLPSKEKLLKFEKETSGHYKAWAAMMLGKLERGEPIRTSYPYPIQIWQLGEQVMMVLGGEPVVEYAIELKRIFGQNIFVLGYSNDVMAYIPSASVLSEGRYEGALSQMAFGLPGTWVPGIEQAILTEAVRLSEQIGVPKSRSTLIPE